jgi:hypothetical protein
MAGYGALCAFGPAVPEAAGNAAYAEYGLLLAVPIGLFIWAIRAFNGWHGTFHHWVVQEATRRSGIRQ